ncbi:MAG: S-layer homology domain-containing protein, partial [Clostridiales bacterium]|nr:S-layer homology domain-containing protein [Clostridiales bacterium]
NTKLIIDPNYGTYAGSKATQTIYVTADRSIADASRTGYYFYGWYVTELNGVYTFTAIWDRGYYSTYSIYYYDFEDGKSEYANFPYGTSIVIDPNGGTAKLSGTSFSTKQYFNIYRDYTLTDASRSGYTFYGWDLTKSGSTYYFTAMWSRYKSDVPYMLNGTDHYAYIKGYPNGSFKPTDTITRAEAATIFYRLLTDATRKAYATSYNTFKDVPATAWYNTAVSTMAKLGIVNGGADGYFRPNDPITRAEIAAMIARCDGAYYTGTSTVFSDTYGHWAAGYIDRAYELGWINGYGTTYAPDRYISRAETVAVLNRVLNRAPQYTSDLTRNYTTFSDVATSAWYYLDVEEAANSHTYTRKSNADYETWTKLIADPSWF